MRKRQKSEIKEEKKEKEGFENGDKKEEKDMEEDGGNHISQLCQSATLFLMRIASGSLPLCVSLNIQQTSGFINMICFNFKLQQSIDVLILILACSNSLPQFFAAKLSTRHLFLKNRASKTFIKTLEIKKLHKFIETTTELKA